MTCYFNTTYYLLSAALRELTFFPYTTLFRSRSRADGRDQHQLAGLALADVLHGVERELRLVGSVMQQLRAVDADPGSHRSEEHTSELQSREKLVCRLLLEKKNK